MKGLTFTLTGILIVAKAGDCWVCPVNTRVFTEVGQRPVLSFSTNGLRNDGDTTDINTFQVVVRTNTIFTVSYENGVVIEPQTTLNGCSLAPSADLANGVLDIRLITAQTNDWGTYRLVHTRRTSSTIQCVTLYLLDTPTTPTITPLGTLYEGTSLSLTCSSTSTIHPSNHSLTMRYDWTIAGSNVKADNKFSFDSNLQKTVTLASLSRSEDNNRVMRCTATETDGKSSLPTSYTISVRYGPDNVTLNIPNVHTVTEGVTVSSIICSADCWPGCVFTWTNVTNNQLISNSDVLTFDTLNRYDTGNYTCLARNSTDPQYSREAEHSFFLRVQYAPDVFLSQSTTELTENSPLDILCKALGVPAVYNYTGFVQRVGDVVVPNSHAESPGVRDSISVNIPSLQFQDTGIYTCYVHNGINGVNKRLIQTATRRIDVRVSPIIILEEATFAGETSGNITIDIPFVSVPEYTTYSVQKFNGQRISTNGKYIFDTRTSLVYTVFYGQSVSLDGNVLRMAISDLSEDDFGIYSLQITNSVNTTNFSIYVAAKSKPSPPTRLKLTTFGNVITFEWKKGFNGGHQQTFVLQTLLNSDGSWTNRNTIIESELKYIKGNGNFEVNLTSLDEGKYRARLVAFNSIGKAEPVEFKDGFEIKELTEEKQASSSGPLIGGIAGGVLGVTALAVVAVVIFLMRGKTEKGHEDSGRLSVAQKLTNISHRTGQEIDNIPDEVENPMYVGGDDVAIPKVTTADIYAKPVKKSSKHNMGAGDIYSVVDKEKKKQDIYENSDNLPMEKGKNSAGVESKKKQVNEGGLVYADLVFAKQPKGQKKLAIHGFDDTTEYAEVDLTKRADPLPYIAKEGDKK